MKWNERFNADHVPTEEEIKVYLGMARSLWEELTAYIEETYQVKPRYEYSSCSLQPGWNVKYKANSRSLCTLYPMDGSFIALVVVGAKEEETVKIELGSGLFTPYVKELFDKTAFSAMGRWLMIEVKDKQVIEDIKCLLAIRVKPKK